MHVYISIMYAILVLNDTGTYIVHDKMFVLHDTGTFNNVPHYYLKCYVIFLQTCYYYTVHVGYFVLYNGMLLVSIVVY